jgi:hypothetical protein
VHDVVDEVEAHRLRTGEHDRGADLRQIERSLEHPVLGERSDDVVARLEVGGDRVVAEWHGRPDRRVRTVAACRRCEAVVLDSHVLEQIEHRPVATGCSCRELLGGEAPRDRRAAFDGPPVQISDVSHAWSR